MADLENPYQPPASHVADVADEIAAEGTYTPGGRAVAAGNGWQWIRDAYGYFRRQPGVWIILIVILFALGIALHFIPLIGWIAGPLVWPVLAGGLMAGCRSIERGGEIELAHLFAGFSRNTGQLMLVAAIGMGLMVLALLPVVIVSGVSGLLAATSGSGFAGLAMVGGALVGALLSFALMIPVYMGLYFAPALVMLQDQSAPRAIAESFRGTLKNVVPFLLYGVIVFVLAIPASMLFMLGWLVLAPVLAASVYTAYRDIYFTR
jgi:uncharacterized membrane protein